ncbi:MAG: hypothetical protein GX112_05850 [Clostridiaceae bacterium]|nr:hypothetical protein [Clostridiaceae bacterium]
MQKKKEWKMAYLNARQVLPPELLAQIQQYLDGQLIYIPKKSARRKPWGSRNGSRTLLQQRNQSIRQAHRRGQSLACLADQLHLSEDAIRKIIYADKARSQPSEPADKAQP